MIDLLYASDGDIDFSDGDLHWCDTGRATDQHKRDILLATPGDYKTSPATGVGAADFLNDESPGLFLRTVRKQMQRDGLQMKEVGFDPQGNLIIDGAYEND